MRLKAIKCLAQFLAHTKSSLYASHHIIIVAVTQKGKEGLLTVGERLPGKFPNLSLARTSPGCVTQNHLLDPFCYLFTHSRNIS